MTITETAPQAKYRKDYQAPDYTIATVDLVFDLGEEGTQVDSKMSMKRNGDHSRPLVLDGQEIETLKVCVDGQEWPTAQVSETDEQLTIEGLPAEFVLEISVRIHPETNFKLNGLYKSSGNFCTQCEAEGFRCITWYLDRPDVMVIFSTTINADNSMYPVLLSNGNKVADEDLGDGRRQVRWEDPFPKPCYLFALVAGNLKAHSGEFTTMSGRKVELEIWVEPQNIEACDHALVSLQKSMKWDEEVYGLEYDLDIYMIVAVGDFNMGAMENKGLNVFNSKYVLARPETATDSDYEGVEGVIAHEYFHNWTGNRVTCKDWFQLTLKEGLTVFRDQEFTSDMTSRAVTRIGNVAGLRMSQFREDAGPMAHPIRPESYIEMDNFYTATVYSKGSEVIRMYHTLIGAANFRKGMDLYFERHDGSAVTCDDFRAAMADASGKNLDQFERWYIQAGTPLLEVERTWDGDKGRFTLTFRQHCPRGQEMDTFEPMLIPVRMALLDSDGSEMPLVLEGEEGGEACTERVLEITNFQQTFVFLGLKNEPCPSLLRGFSAPVDMRLSRTAKELSFLMAHDKDSFSRWDAAQELFGDTILELTGRVIEGKTLLLPEELKDAMAGVLADEEMDGAMRGLMLSLPAESILEQRMEVVDPDALFEARSFVFRKLAEALEVQFKALFDASKPSGTYSADQANIQRRSEHTAALAYLVRSGNKMYIEAAKAQYDNADNMTDMQGALGCLGAVGGEEFDQALAAFHERWNQDPLVMDKWFMMQAGNRLPGAVERVKALMAHKDFSIKNPNRVRSVLGAFAMGNPTGFHQADGAGYDLVANAVLELDKINPQIASGIVRAFNSYRRYGEARQVMVFAQLERIAATEGLSKNTSEIVGRALKS
ncbi:MAG: aminopeptidase N [bacterium]|nr:aminopeptidase N [bacterium]